MRPRPLEAPDAAVTAVPRAAAGWAVLAGLAASVGDLLLLWAGDSLAAHPLLPIPAPPAALIAGHYLGVLAIPVYGLGYAAAGAALGGRGGRALVALGGAGGALGAVVHGVTATVIRAAASGMTGLPGDGPAAFVAAAGPLLVPLWLLVAVLIAAGSVVWTATAGAAFGRLRALASPLALALVLALLGAPFALGRAFLVPAAPNLAHVGFFALIARARPAR